MFFRVLTHIETVKRDVELLRQYLGQFCLADTGRTYEEEASYGLVIVQKSGLGHKNGLGNLSDGLFLSVYLLLETFLHIIEVILGFVVRCRNVDPAYICQGLGDYLFRHLLLVACLCVCTCLIKQVYRLVRQTAVLDVPAAERDGLCDYILVVLHPVVLRQFRQDALDDLGGVLIGRFLNVNLTEKGENSVVSGAESLDVFVCGGDHELHVS